MYVATAGYLANLAGTRKPLVATLTGLLITGLVVGYFWLLTGRMASVERQVAYRWLELRERERYIRHLVDNTGDAIFLCNKQGKILDINECACNSLGYSRAELLSMTVADVELPAVAADPEPLAKRLAEEYPRRYESIHLRKDGTTFPVEVRMTSVGIGAQRLLLAVVRDITDRKRAEDISLEKPQPSAEAVELQHDVVQQLTAALDNFQTADRLYQSDPETARKTFDEGVRLLRKVTAPPAETPADGRPCPSDRVVATADDLIRTSVPLETTNGRSVPNRLIALTCSRPVC